MFSSTEKLTMSPSMNMARNPFAFAMGSVKMTTASGMRIPKTARQIRVT